MNRLYDEQTLIERESKCLGLSVVLHLFILAIMCFNFSWNTSEFEKISAGYFNGGFNES